MDYIQITINVQPRDPWVDVLIDQLGELGCDSFEETSEGCLAYIPKKDFTPEVESNLALLKKSDHYSLSYQTEIIEGQNWNELWEQSFDPILVNNWVCIRAPFHESANNVQHEVIIEPKMSFGTGHHQTTYMMVQAMQNIAIEQKNVLDMGTGTGILGILAAKMGAKKVIGIDIEDWAVENCIENCERNNVKMDVLLGGKEMIPQEQFDIVLANINRNILTDQMSDYAAHITAGGYLFLSGFLVEDKNVIEASGKDNGFELTQEYKKDNWLCLVLCKK